MLHRELNLPKSQSYFLFGARQTGKTTLVKEIFHRDGLSSYNLLLSQEYLRLVAQPGILREEVLRLPQEIRYVFIDEVQRVPQLLNEVQALIDEKVPRHFILTGSSARKLRRGQGNLLAGRALSLKLFPLTLRELKTEFSLETALSFGTLPQIYLTQRAERAGLLRSYADTYLREEIEAEALSRNLGGFVRFLQVAAQMNGEILNFANIARDVGISAVTVKEYFSILDDTLLGHFLHPFHHSERKRHRLSPKFYWFDTGVLRAAQQRLALEVRPGTFEFGNYFETWVINEVMRLNWYQSKDWSLSFLRTAGGVEVDLIIEKPGGEILAVEIKSKPAPSRLDFEAGFNAIRRLVPQARCVCVCTAERPRLADGYEILPYTDFLGQLAA